MSNWYNVRACLLRNEVLCFGKHMTKKVSACSLEPPLTPMDGMIIGEELCVRKLNYFQESPEAQMCLIRKNKI